MWIGHSQLFPWVLGILVQILGFGQQALSATEPSPSHHFCLFVFPTHFISDKTTALSVTS